jgi:hypothetical protein
MSDEALTRIAEALERLRPPPAKAPDWAAAEALSGMPIPTVWTPWRG